MSKIYYNPRYTRGTKKRGTQGGRNDAGFKSVGDAAQHASKGSKPEEKTESRTLRKSSRRHVNPLYVVIRKFWNLFNAYDENMQNTETKRETLNLAIRLSPKYYPDTFRFWQDLLDETKVLLDSKRFNEYCDNVLEYSAQAVAEHLVVEGKATVNKVLKEGLENYGEKARMFSERLYTDSRNLYGDQPGAENENSFVAENHGE